MFSTYRNDGFALQSVKKKEIRKINVEELNKTDGYVCRLLLSTRIRYLGKGY